MKWLKTLLCSHVDKEIAREHLRDSREAYGSDWSVQLFGNFSYYSVSLSCIKCERKKIQEKRILKI